MVVGGFFVFRNSVVKLCVEWALSLNKRVGESACKRHMPDIHVFVPTLHKALLQNYWNTKKTSNEHFAYFCGEIFVFWGGEEVHTF